jgi:tetratricopeptide (TPR) repeat protein
MRLMEDKAELQQEMDSLAEQWAALEKSGFLEKYAFVPAHPSAISYVTANFLHAGWLHLIGNMWLLWLAGAILKICQLHLKTQDHEAAWQDFQEYANAGGDRMPAATWLELGRIAEGQQNFERAMTEYEHLAQAYPNERQSVLALLSAGRLALKQLNRPSDALLYYKAAKASKVPHVDWESNIQAGIQAAEKAAGDSYAPAIKP